MNIKKSRIEKTKYHGIRNLSGIFEILAHLSKVPLFY